MIDLNNEDFAKKPILLTKDECFVFAKILTEYRGDTFLPKNKELFYNTEKTEQEINNCLAACAEGAEKKVIHRGYDIKNVNKTVLAKKVINYFENLSENGKQWIMQQSKEVLFAINSVFEFEQNFSILKNSIEKNRTNLLYKEISREDEQKYYEDYDKPGRDFSKSSVSVCNAVYDKSLIKKYYDENEWPMLRHKITENCGKEYAEVQKMWECGDIHHNGEKVDISLDNFDIRNKLYYKSALKMLGYEDKEDYSSFFHKYIDGNENKLIETNIILNQICKKIKIELKRKVADAYGNKLYVKFNSTGIFTRQDIVKYANFKSSILDIDLNTNQLQFLLDNKELLEIDFVYKLFNYPTANEIKNVINTFAKMKGINHKSNIRSTKLKLNIDQICYDYFMNRNEIKIIKENFAGIGTFMQYVPQAYERMFQFTRKFK